MSAWKRFVAAFRGDSVPFYDALIRDLATETFLKDLAVQSCINLISNTVARSEFRTYERGVETRADTYYLFNVEPSPNRNASKFWREVIARLVHDNEALVIQEDDHLFVAESFTRKKYAFRDHVYSDVVIDGLELKRAYYEPEVLYFELHNARIKAVLDGVYRSYAQLIELSKKRYQKRSVRRGVLNIPAGFPQTEKSQAELRELLEKRFKTFFSAEGDALIPLTNGLTYTEMEDPSGARPSVEGRDIRALIDDVFDFVAMGFQVPAQLLKGDVADTDKAVSNFLTFCINPLAELLTDEINRKMYSKQLYLQRTYMTLDTSHIRAVDIRDTANALDVLVRVGAYTVDDCLKHLGMQPLGGDIGEQRWMTKNYAPIEAVIEGGE